MFILGYKVEEHYQWALQPFIILAFLVFESENQLNGT